MSSNQPPLNGSQECTQLAVTVVTSAGFSSSHSYSPAEAAGATQKDAEAELLYDEILPSLQQHARLEWTTVDSDSLKRLRDSSSVANNRLRDSSSVANNRLRDSSSVANNNRLKYSVLVPQQEQNHTATPKDHLLKSALLGAPVSTSLEAGAQLSIQCVPVDNPDGNEAGDQQRMSGTNGYDRNRMTGSSGGNNQNLAWLSDAVSSRGQPQSHTQAPPPLAEGMLVGQLGGGAGAIAAIHDAGTRSIVSGTAGPSPQVTMAAVFRTPPTASEHPQRYPAVYSTAGVQGTNIGQFSPLYSSHGQSSSLVTMAPYSAFYNQYPSYSPAGAILAGHYPAIDSYSAVLRSMGSHADQAQLPRAPFGTPGSVAQYSLLGASRRSLTPTSSPGPSSAFASQATGASATAGHDMDAKLRTEHEYELQRRHSIAGYMKEDKARRFSPPAGISGTSRGTASSSTLRESPKMKAEHSGAQDFYKGSSGREGSLKHRILTRPSELPSGSVRPSSFTSVDERSPKRTKFSNPELSISLQTQDAGSRDMSLSATGSSTQHATESGGDNPASHHHLHFPPHFVKGSIIQLANGELKRVENLETQDFVQSADISSDLRIDSSTVVNIDERRVQGTAVLGFVVGEHKVQVTVEATLEHPFFVFSCGWSSCEPGRTLQRYGLDCRRLSVGDVCISLTHKEVTAHAEEISQQQQRQQKREQEQHKKHDNTNTLRQDNDKNTLRQDNNMNTLRQDNNMNTLRQDKINASRQHDSENTGGGFKSEIATASMVPSDEGQGRFSSHPAYSSKGQGPGYRSAGVCDSNHKGEGKEGGHSFLLPTSHGPQAQEQKGVGGVEKMDSMPLRKRQWSAASSPSLSPGTIDKSDSSKDNADKT